MCAVHTYPRGPGDPRVAPFTPACSLLAWHTQGRAVLSLRPLHLLWYWPHLSHLLSVPELPDCATLGGTIGVVVMWKVPWEHGFTLLICPAGPAGTPGTRLLAVPLCLWALVAFLLLPSMPCSPLLASFLLFSAIPVLLGRFSEGQGQGEWLLFLFCL